jgi:hypothetical protein
LRAAGVKRRHDERRRLRLDEQQRRRSGEWVGYGPVLERLLEAGEVRERLRVREHGLLDPFALECRAQPVEELLNASPRARR